MAGKPAVVRDDTVTGACVNHLIPGPTGPVTVPTMPYLASLTDGLATSVTIGGKPVAVEGSSGDNTEATHQALDATDARKEPATQQATITAGSGSVTFEGRPAAYTGCEATACLVSAAPPVVTGTATTVLVGT